MKLCWDFFTALQNGRVQHLSHTLQRIIYMHWKCWISQTFLHSLYGRRQISQISLFWFRYGLMDVLSNWMQVPTWKDVHIVVTLYKHAERVTTPRSSSCSLQEMDIESLEAGNQSLQADLKLAFKRIGDLQAAIEDEMESDDNEDLINRYSCWPLRRGLRNGIRRRYLIREAPDNIFLNQPKSKEADENWWASCGFFFYARLLVGWLWVTGKLFSLFPFAEAMRRVTKK